jgi:hypothetical protein
MHAIVHVIRGSIFEAHDNDGYIYSPGLAACTICCTTFEAYGTEASAVVGPYRILWVVS